MKRLFVAITCLTTIVYALSCSKSGSNTSNLPCTDVAAPLDSPKLQAFAKQYGITPTEDTSYMFYQIITQGTGPVPGLSSTVYVRYAAKLMDGTYVDSSGTSVGFILGNLIKGWQYGLSKIMPGGEIKLLIPSALAYGCQATGPIPGNSPLYFNIYLDSLK